MNQADFKVEPDGTTPTADLDGATATVAAGATDELVVTLTGSTTGSAWTTSGEIDLDVFDFGLKACMKPRINPRRTSISFPRT